MGDSLKGVRCVVLGGAGFIGRGLIGALKAQDAEVSGFGRIGAFSRHRADLQWFDGDFRDANTLYQAVRGNEIVFHLLGASIPEISNSDPIGDIRSTVIPTVKLLEICRQSAVKKVIFASSGGTVYGVPQFLPIDEQHPTNPISAYGANKLMVEKYLSWYEHQHGLQHISLRISNPFGPFQNPVRGQGLIAKTIFTLMSNRPVEIWGDGSFVRDYVFIDDVVGAFIKAAQYNGDQRIFNVGAGVGKSVNQVVNDVALALDIPSPQKVYTTSRKTDVPTNILDISLAKRNLGWSPTKSWSEAIVATAHWMRENATIKAMIEGNVTG